MKKTIALLLSIILCFPMGMSVYAESESDEIDYTTGTPWLCSELEGNVTADTPTDPKDDYALWANKDRILSMEIPYEKGFIAANNTTDVNIKVNEDKRALFQGEAPKEHDARLAYDYYYLLCDWDARDEMGVAPLKEMIDVVEGITSLDALTEYLVKTSVEDRLFGLWNEDVVQDMDNPGATILSLKRPFSLINDPGEYREMTDYGKDQMAVYESFFGRMMEKLGYSEEETKQKLDNCLKWETLINSGLASFEERQSSEFKANANTHLTHDELLAATPNMPLLEILEGAEGYPVMDQYLLPDPKAIEALNEHYTEENLPLIRDYIILHGIYLKAEALDFESYALSIDAQEMVSSGEHAVVDKENFFNDNAYDELSSLAGWALAKFYVEEHSNPEAKERLTALVDEIVKAYYGIIEDADFISDETRAGAIAKLDSMSRKVLYPDNWEDYSFEDVNFASKEEGGSLWDAYCALKKHEHDKLVVDVGKPFNRESWTTQPYIGNCVYQPGDNSFTITAAFTQAPNYREDMSDEELYAYMGTGIAHEISHAFDAQGAQYDKDGNFINWWTDEDYAAFNEKNKKLAAYFNGMHPWEGQDFNGEAMVGEACADMTALKCILRIAAGKPDFDYDKFFRAYADRCASKEPLTWATVLLQDEHPMGYLRVNTNLQQYDEFLDFYGITEGDNMYLAPEDRVTIW